ncbi:universal stress protein [Haloarcula sediminis]|uniref:universal stress protein n=1 Tax=Haloarcula sediminis TaxID=3111777 RepID=UPI002D775A8A|nr:universal stress protein [Haloarcula sp. CK38]
MTLVVPFDGSELAEAALVRATEFGNAFDENVLALSVIPKENTEYARKRDWLRPGEEFDLESVVSTLHEQVTELCPAANFRHKVIGRSARSGAIAKRVRKGAREEDASMVFIGSDNAGHIVTTVSSVGSTVAADDAYDVVIVRHRSPAKIAKLKDSSPHRKSKSDFYLPE